MVFVYNLVDPTRLLLFSCFLFRQNEFYSNFLERMGFSLGGLTLSPFLRKMGCPGSLALVILSLLGVFFGSESALINWMNSSGSASGSASESWQNSTYRRKMPRPNHPQATPRRTLNLKHHPFRSCENESKMLFAHASVYENKKS